jgi:8-oxo-dGTP diphosphatase
VPANPSEGQSAYRNPTPTVDAIIEIGAAGAEIGVSAAGSPGRRQIVLIERRNEPRGWALPGGFVDYGETVAAAAVREAREETGLEVELTELFHVYSDPDRDARLHTVSTVFIARAQGEPVGADDADRSGVFELDALPSPLVFDHALILADYRRYLTSGVRPPPER